MSQLSNLEYLRAWVDSKGVEKCTSALLRNFQRSNSAADREQLWTALLEVLSIKEVGVPNSFLTVWTLELLKGLSNTDPEIRRQSLSALTDIAPRLSSNADVIRSLVRSLYDESQAVRNQAVYAAEAFANPQLMTALLDSLQTSAFHKPAVDDPDNSSLWHALFALDVIIGRSELTSAERHKMAQTLSRLVESFALSKIDIWKIGDSLGDHIKGQDAMTILKAMSTNSDARLRYSAIHGLGHLGGAEAVMVIERALRDPEVEIRDEAHRALAEMSQSKESLS